MTPDDLLTLPDCHCWARDHRGQVTTMLRQLQAAPPGSMALIAFYRERATPEGFR